MAALSAWEAPTDTATVTAPAATVIGITSRLTNISPIARYSSPWPLVNLTLTAFCRSPVSAMDLEGDGAIYHNLVVRPGGNAVLVKERVPLAVVAPDEAERARRKPLAC
jgi:hypothetical protein